MEEYRIGGPGCICCQDHTVHDFRQAVAHILSTVEQKRIRAMAQPVIRCKVRISWVAPSFAADGTKLSERVVAQAVYSPDPASENAQWSDATPSFALDMVISNPSALGTFESGKEYYVDFTPAE